MIVRLGHDAVLLTSLCVCRLSATTPAHIPGRPRSRTKTGRLYVVDGNSCLMVVKMASLTAPG